MRETSEGCVGDVGVGNLDRGAEKGGKLIGIRDLSFNPSIPPLAH